MDKKYEIEELVRGDILDGSLMEIVTGGVSSKIVLLLVNAAILVFIQCATIRHVHIISVNTDFAVTTYVSMLFVLLLLPCRY